MKKRSKKYKPRRIDPIAGLQLLDNARPFDPGDTTEQHIKTRMCWQRLQDGTADTDDFDRVAVSVNLGHIRAAQIDERLLPDFDAAHDAALAIKGRYERWRKWQVLPHEASAITQALDLYEQITDASSPLQMVQATKAMAAVIRKKMQQPKDCHP